MRLVLSAPNCVSKAIEKATAHRSVNALITETFDLGREQYDEAVRNGVEPFSVVIKDCFASIEGGCLIGKANMDEFAMGSTSMHSHYGAVKHFSHAFATDSALAEDDWRVAGGSSGGCAVAVALGMAQVALGSDTGGSTRNPAAFNGVVGFKPSYGTLSRHGLVPLANSFDVPSIFANSVGDCRHYYDIMRGVDEMDSTSLATNSVDAILDKRNEELTIGLPKEYRNELLSLEAEKIWDQAAERFRAMGCNVVEISLPLTEYSIVCYHILAESDIASNMARYDGIRFGYRTEDKNVESFNDMITRSRTIALNYSVKRRIIAGNFFNVKENRGKYYHQAAKVRRLIKQDFDVAFQRVDAILAPTTSHTAPLVSDVCRINFRERQRHDDFFTQPANMAGLPAITIPVGVDASGLPLGAQIMCDYRHDARCLQFAELLENSIKLSG